MESTEKRNFNAENFLRDGANSITACGPSKSNLSTADLFAMKLRPPPIPGKMSKFKENELKVAMMEVQDLSGDRIIVEDDSLRASVDSCARTDRDVPDKETTINNKNISMKTFMKSQNLAHHREITTSELDTSMTSSTDSVQSEARPNDVQVNMISKVLVVGNAKCGKSSIINRYASHKFDKEYRTTIGADFFVRKDVLVSDPDLEHEPPIGVRMHLWDIAGQDRFQS